MPYSDMKMTMHIDDALLKEVMAITGAKSKTAAVSEALRRVTFKFRQREQLRKGLGMTAEEIMAGFDAEMALGIKPNPNPPIISKVVAPAKTKDRNDRRKRAR